MGMGRFRSTTALLVACLAGCALAAEGAGAAIPQLNVNYDLGSPPSPANRNFLDVYRPDGSSPGDSRPVVVYVHGGGWRTGNKTNQITDKVNLFTGAGYVFVSLNYRLSPDPVDESYPADRVRFPDHPDDVGEAIGWLDRNVAAFGGDPSRMLLIGHSAGAHLVSLVSTDPRYVEAHGVEPWQLIGTVALDGDAYDVADRISEVGAAAPLFYSAFATPAENAVDGTWTNASPEAWAGPRDPEHLIVTQAAAPGRIADAEELAVALGQDPATSVFRAPYDHEGINDAVGGPADTAGETAAIMSFFDRMVDGSRTPEVAIKRHPGRRVKLGEGRSKRRIEFAFGAKPKDARFECRLDGKEFRSCRTPWSRRVGEGRHRFRVRPFAPSGRPGEAESFRFRVLPAR